MKTAVHRLLPGSTQFLLGRWFGEAALDAWEPSPDVEGIDWDAVEAVFGSVKDQLDATTRQAFMLRMTRFTPVTAFLADLGSRCVRDVSECDHADSLRCVIDSHVGELWRQTDGDPFQTSFDAAIDAARAFYASCGFDTPGRFRLELDLVDGPRVHERPGPQIDGFTHAEAAGAKIVIKLAAGCFGDAVVRAVPAVLFHELIVHACAGAQAIESTGPWAEAWMDVVAAGVYREAMVAGSYGGADPFAAAGAPDTLEKVGGVLHDDRFALGGAGTREVHRRRLARDEARRASGVLDQELGVTSPAFRAFCAAINRGPLPPPLRDEMARKVCRRLRDGDAELAAAFVSCATALLDPAMPEGDRIASTSEFFIRHGS